MKNQRLRARIVEQFGTASDFAVHLGVREEIVSRVVCGRRQLSEKEQIRWAEALKADPAACGFEEKV
jgi:plasmid maintenance system antidote protein VapI